MFYKINILLVAFAVFLAGTTTFPASTPFVSAVSASETEDLLKALREAEPAARGRKARELADLGQEAVDGLAQVVAAHREEPSHFAAGCIVALSEIGPEAADATDALLSAMDSYSAKIRYLSARALGFIREGEGGEETEIVRKTNSSLLAYLVTAEGAEIYAPGIALARINSDALDPVAKERLGEQELKDEVFQWFSENLNRIADVDERPWPLLLRSTLNAFDPDRQEQAKELLLEQRPPRAVNYLVNKLKNTDFQDEETLWEASADLLEELSNIELDRDTARDDLDDAIRQWRDEWYRKLKTLEGELYRNYVWQKMEQAILDAKYRASQQTIDALDAIQKVVMHQFDSADDIPPDASDAARDFIEGRLELKERFRSKIEAYKDAGDDTGLRHRAILDISAITRDEKGLQVGRPFLEELAELARAEDASRILENFSRILTTLGARTIRLDEERDEREDALDEWLQEVSI